VALGGEPMLPGGTEASAPSEAVDGMATQQPGADETGTDEIGTEETGADATGTDASE
jgi:hypothetical protein